MIGSWDAKTQGGGPTIWPPHFFKFLQWHPPPSRGTQDTCPICTCLDTSLPVCIFNGLLSSAEGRALFLMIRRKPWGFLMAQECGCGTGYQWLPESANPLRIAVEIIGRIFEKNFWIFWARVKLAVSWLANNLGGLFAASFCLLGFLLLPHSVCKAESSVKLRMWYLLKGPIIHKVACSLSMDYLLSPPTVNLKNHLI